MRDLIEKEDNRLSDLFYKESLNYDTDWLFRFNQYGDRSKKILIKEKIAFHNYLMMLTEIRKGVFRDNLHAQRINKEQS